jgi:hypothetical protein
MPCDSRVTKTQVTNVDRLVAALEAEGHRVTSRHETYVTTSTGLAFSRNTAKDSFIVRDYQNATPVLRRYAELGVREFAKRRGYSVAREEGPKQRLLLTNRRGK